MGFHYNEICKATENADDGKKDEMDEGEVRHLALTIASTSA
jgi:hypothetical protein